MRSLSLEFSADLAAKGTELTFRALLAAAVGKIRSPAAARLLPEPDPPTPSQIYPARALAVGCRRLRLVAAYRSSYALTRLGIPFSSAARSSRIPSKSTGLGRARGLRAGLDGDWLVDRRAAVARVLYHALRSISAVSGGSFFSGNRCRYRKTIKSSADLGPRGRHPAATPFQTTR